MKVRVEQNVEATMRDGTVLRADIYRPDGGGRFPTVVNRTPYDKSGKAGLGRRLAERGYLFVAQDVRGRYASDGVFRPGFYSAETDDAEDGYDTVEWAAALPQSNGRVGTVGCSYDAWVQWELAPTRPPHLKTMLASGIAANLLDRELSGVLRLGRVLDWTINNLSVDAARRLGDPWKPRSSDESRRLWNERDRIKWLWYLPLMEMPDDIMPGLGERWRTWLADHATDHFRFQERHREVEVPVLSMTGWYDQQIGTIKHFTGMRENGRTQLARDNQHLIVGPWTHTLEDLSRKVGEVDFGEEAEWDFFDLADRWFSHWLKGEQAEGIGWSPVQVFVMGANRWRTSEEWPLPGTEFTDYFLHSEGHADMRSGVGSLSRAVPGDEPPDRYVYDPRDPVMSLYTPGGQLVPMDQRPLDGRRDVMVYQTPPLEEPLEVVGPITVELFASSSARDTDFTAKLVDVYPDGFAQELCHGVVRARYRESFDEPTLIEPDAVYEYTIKVNPTGNLFRRGHRIRLDISSSDFPNFDRNHNTGGDDYRESALRAASQVVYHDPSRPSRVVLPVLRQ